MTTYKASNVAKYIIYLSSKNEIDEGVREGITNLKLQKILYFAQAYFLAKLDRPLFSDSISAWKYGPVVESVYHEYKSNINNPIILTKDESNISDIDKRELDKVWSIFGGLSANKLVDITHNHQPWKDHYDSDNETISNEELKEYYKNLI